MERFVCIHGHFYQPPRENPWLEEVEMQDTAYPYHDWNERINAECYAPNAASRILDGERRIIDIVNNYAKISFNFGPTLLAWMERKAPDVLRAIVEADKKSRELRGGHGAALAQAFNHMIMPLATRADKRTQILWGLKDFEHRFGRKPEGMWLPETAVDLESLDLMAEQGVGFTLLAPRQARRARRLGDRRWRDVSGEKIDPKLPYLCRLPSGRTITLFFYDGPISRDLAFGGLLKNGEAFARRLAAAFEEAGPARQLVHIATDGETYGHHHRFGDMALAYCLYVLESQGLAKLSVYGQFLEHHPPEHEVEIYERTSWSCVHGVERWRSDCGCQSGLHPGWHQKWRAPLRSALDWLRDNFARIFESKAGPLLREPWAARDDYIQVILDRTSANVDRFLEAHSAAPLSVEDRIQVLKLLEMQRHAMLMYTSCGWFFDELSGLETVQILQYAGRAMQLARETSGFDLETAFLDLLERAPSNLSEIGTGRKVYELFVKPAEVDMVRVAVHYAVSSAFTDYPEKTRVYNFDAERQDFMLRETGRQRLAVGRLRVRSVITLQEDEVSFFVLHLGEQQLVAAAREFMGQEAYDAMKARVKDSFERGDIADITRIIEREFGRESYSLWHLFRDEQRRILGRIFDSSIKEVNQTFRQLYEQQAALIQAGEKLRMPLPRQLAVVVESILNQDVQDALGGETLDPAKALRAAEDLRRLSLTLDKATLGFVLDRQVEQLMSSLAGRPDNAPVLEKAVELLETVASLGLDLNLWRAQNLFFSIGRGALPALRTRADHNDREAQTLITLFDRLGDSLQVRMS
jgi:alpha-amylase/alpha-mannosidase (GH57 family)